MNKNATQTYGWSTSQGTQVQVAYVGPNDTWKGGFTYSASRGSVTGFTAPITTSYLGGISEDPMAFRAAGPVLLVDHLAVRGGPFGCPPVVPERTGTAAPVRDGFRITYDVDGTTYRRFFPAQLAVCTS